MHKPDGGQAFPSPAEKNINGQFIRSEQPGMSLRDYFMAHAPVAPQSWFQPSMPECPPEDYQGDDGTKYESLHAAEKALGEFGPFKDLNYTIAREWAIERSKQRQLQWPYAWADEQLKQRYWAENAVEAKRTVKP